MPRESARDHLETGVRVIDPYDSDGAPVAVDLSWLDGDSAVSDQPLELAPGRLRVCLPPLRCIDSPEPDTYAGTSLFHGDEAVSIMNAGDSRVIREAHTIGHRSSGGAPLQRLFGMAARREEEDEGERENACRI